MCLMLHCLVITRAWGPYCWFCYDGRRVLWVGALRTGHLRLTLGYEVVWGLGQVHGSDEHHGYCHLN